MSKNVYVIAEVGSVHDGSFGNAQRLIDVAASCGADAVKFQTHLPAAETLKRCAHAVLFQGRAPL
jgi:N,N'-diacetyllegionaminate synthase